MNSTAKTIIILVVLVGVIAAFSYLAVKRSKPDEEELGYTAVLMCANPDCQKQYEGRVVAGTPPPFVCKYCGKKTAYRAMRCLDCDSVFPLIVQEDPTKPESEEIRTQECPECGSTYFEIVPTRAEQEEAEKQPVSTDE